MKWIEFTDPKWVDWGIRSNIERFLMAHPDWPEIHFGLNYRLELHWIWGPDDVMDLLAERLEERMPEYKFVKGRFKGAWLGALE